MPDKFPSRPGELFPVYHVFLELSQWRDARVIPTRSSQPLSAISLFLEKDGRRRWLLANFTPEVQQIRLPAGGKDALRELGPYAVVSVDEEAER